MMGCTFESTLSRLREQSGSGGYEVSAMKDLEVEARGAVCERSETRLLNAHFSFDCHSIKSQPSTPTIFITLLSTCRIHHITSLDTRIDMHSPLSV